jgi:hypothetical protein
MQACNQDLVHQLPVHLQVPILQVPLQDLLRLAGLGLAATFWRVHTRLDLLLLWLQLVVLRRVLLWRQQASTQQQRSRLRVLVGLPAHRAAGRGVVGCGM